jgi:hypothetical protein
MHWTTKAFKPQGRQLIDSSDESNGRALNSDEARQQLEAYYGTINHVTLDDIIEYILNFQSLVAAAPSANPDDDELILFKGDLKGAFTLLNVRADDVPLFASELTDGLVLIYPTGSFGWTGTPFCFQVITRQLVTLLRRRVLGSIWAYVDDIMGICRRRDLAFNIDTVRTTCTDLLGPDAMAEDKWAYGPTLEMIGWSVCLTTQRVGISERNAFKVLYGFFHLDIDSVVCYVNRPMLERLAAWSARYTQVVRQAAPLTSVLFGQLNSTTHNRINLTVTTRSAVALWRVLLCMMELDPTTHTRTLQSFQPAAPSVSIHFDASLFGLGVYISDPSHPQPVLAASQISVRHLQLGDRPHFQNTMEFLSLTFGIVMLVRRGYGNCTVRAIGDSRTALKWAKTERFSGMRGTRVAMVFIALCTRFNIIVTDTEHIAGTDNGLCDDLSRFEQSVPDVFPHLTNDATSDSELVSALLALADPRSGELPNQTFDQLWLQIHSILNLI